MGTRAHAGLQRFAWLSSEVLGLGLSVGMPAPGFALGVVELEFRGLGFAAVSEPETTGPLGCQPMSVAGATAEHLLFLCDVNRSKQNPAHAGHIDHHRLCRSRRASYH